MKRQPLPKSGIRDALAGVCLRMIYSERTMQRRRSRKVLVLLLLILTLLAVCYCVTFMTIWSRMPRHIVQTSRGLAEYVEFHETRFTWKTRVLWEPAFWFIENGLGYELVAYAAASDQSITVYGRSSPSTNVMEANHNYELPTKNIFYRR